MPNFKFLSPVTLSASINHLATVKIYIINIIIEIDIEILNFKKLSLVEILSAQFFFSLRFTYYSFLFLY